MIFEDITFASGRTPLVRLKKISEGLSCVLAA